MSIYIRTTCLAAAAATFTHPLQPPMPNLLELVSGALLLLCAAPHFGSVTLSAQALTIACGNLRVSGETCHGESTTGTDSLQQRVLQVVVTRGGGTVSGALVRFRPTSGTVHPDTAYTGADGVAQVIWMRSGGAQPAGIAVDARIVDEQQRTTASGLKYLEITRQRAAAPRVVEMEVWNGGMQSWFENTALRDPVVFHIEEHPRDAAGTLLPAVPITDDSVCNAQRVVFRAYSGAGTITPDTGVAAVYPIAGTDRQGCFVEARWALGAGPGRREMRGTLLPGRNYALEGRPVRVEASARALPRLVAGFAYAYNRSYPGLEADSQTTYHVERTLDDGRVVKYDSTYTPPSAFKEFDGEWSVRSFVGVTTPVPLGGRLRRVSDHLSFTGGVDLANLGDRWFAGVSLARLPFGLAAEALPLDIQLLGHWRRNQVVVNPLACGNGTGDCERDERMRFQGVAFMVSADASSVISDIVKKLAP